MNLKLKLLLTSLTALFLHLNAQSTFYNKGALSIIASDTTHVTLYIPGDFKAGSDSDNNSITSNISMKSSRIVITGDFINNVTSSTVFNSSYSQNGGWVELRSNTPQKIDTDTTNSSALRYKRGSYIDFPNLKINNSNHITIDSKIGVQVNNLQLNKGWLILDSRRVIDNDFSGVITSDLKNNRSILAHLLVNGNIDYRGWSSSNINERGFVEVNIALDPYKNRVFGDTTSIIAFGTPFKNLKADYFMWNHLLTPTNESFIGPNKTSNGDPSTNLKPGVGYAVGIDVRGSDVSNYTIDLDPQWADIDFTQRAKDHYYFNRFRFTNDPDRSANNIYKTVNYLVDSAYQLEKLVDTDVTVDLVPGFNYLANPFTVPLNLEDLLGNNEAVDWDIIADGQDATNRDIVNRVWVLKGDALAYAPQSNRPRYFEVVYNYYLAKKVGGTYTNEYGDGDDGLTIAPLQMFVINAKKNATITIPRKKRSMSAVKFIRSGKYKRQDDFIIEVIDNNTAKSDRASIVLRTSQELAENKEYSNVARLTTSSSSGNNTKGIQATAVEGLVTPNIFSQIYTVDETTNKALTVKFLASDTTTSTPLYLTPATTRQDITLRGLRMDTKYNVNTIFLEDRITNKTVELNDETLYHTISNPNDPIDRFILHFQIGENSSIEDNQFNSSLYATYEAGILTVADFGIKDYGNDIYLYNMQGHLILKHSIDNTRMELPCFLNSGAYIVKTTGSNPQIIKLLVK